MWHVLKYWKKKRASFKVRVSIQSGCSNADKPFTYGNLGETSRFKNNKTVKNKVRTSVSLKAGRGGKDLF